MKLRVACQKKAQDIADILNIGFRVDIDGHAVRYKMYNVLRPANFKREQPFAIQTTKMNTVDLAIHNVRDSGYGPGELIQAVKHRATTRLIHAMARIDEYEYTHRKAHSSYSKAGDIPSYEKASDAPSYPNSSYPKAGDAPTYEKAGDASGVEKDRIVDPHIEYNPVSELVL